MPAAIDLFPRENVTFTCAGDTFKKIISNIIVVNIFFIINLCLFYN